MHDTSDELTDQDLGRGLIYIHEKLGTRILEHQALSAHVYALTELLIANSVVSLRDFEQRKNVTQDKMINEALSHWQGAQVLTDETDKYSIVPAEVNCGERMHLCHAACCRLTFHLSKQDLHEQVVRWDVGMPYTIRKREDGWCTHCDKATKRCDVHEQRPLVCRQYDCRHDTRIWEDFDKAIPNPQLTRDLS